MTVSLLSINSAEGTTNPPNTSAPAGSQRYLIAVTAIQGAGDTMTAATYGGQSMSLLVDSLEVGTNRVYVWGLNEAGIDAATDNTFDGTYIGSPAGNRRGHAVAFFGNVDQTGAPSETATSSGTTDPWTDTLTGLDGAYGFAYTRVTDTPKSQVWGNSWVEFFDSSTIVSADDSAATKAFSGSGTQTISVSGSGGDTTIVVAVRLDPSTEPHSSDSGSIVTNAEDNIGTILLASFDIGSVQAQEAAFGFSEASGSDSADLSSVESSSILKNPEWVSASETASSLSSVESGFIQSVGTTQKYSLDIDSPHITSVESRSIVGQTPIAQKSSTELGKISDLIKKNLILYNAQPANPIWTKTGIEIQETLSGTIPETGDKSYYLEIPLNGTGNCRNSQNVTLDSSDQEYVLSWRFSNSSLGPSHFYLDLSGVGLDVRTWFATNSGGLATVATTGADVLEAKVDVGVNGVGTLQEASIRFKTSIDLTGSVIIGLSQSDGTVTVAPHATREYLFDFGAQLVKADQARQTSSDPLIIQYGSIIPFHQDSAQLRQTDLFVSGTTEVGYLESGESVSLNIAGTIVKSRTDSGDLTAAEISNRTQYKASTESGGIGVAESAFITSIDYDPTWEDDDVPWGGLLLGSKDLAPVYATRDNFFALGLGADQFLESYLERRAVVFDQGRALLGRYIYPQIIGPDGGSVWISLGGHNTPDGVVDWEGPYEFVIGEDISVDFAVAGRYLAVKFESSETSVWDLQSFDIDYEVTGVY